MKKHLSNQTRKRMLSILGMLLLSVPFVLAQVLVKGTVKDNLGEGVPGASVQVKGTSQGTITDLDGKFTLNIPQKNATLVISFIGYVTVEQKADSQKPMVITLKEDTKTLDEVVVVGYQEVRRRDLTGSVAKANMADVLTAPVASFDQALGGRIAGVNVTSGEGMPGGNMSIVIRGNNSLTQENSPLFVIDGFPIEDSSAASTLNPSDIESLDFLKDASATAIYGASGSLKGVVEQAFHQMHAKQNVHLENHGLIEKRYDSLHHKEASLTIHDYTRMVINFVLAHNQQHLETYPLTKEMIEKNIAPVPAILWEYGSKKYGMPQPIPVLKQYLYSLMTPIKAKISKRGISYKGLWYFAPNDKRLMSAMYAAGTRRMPFEVRMDMRDVGAIYYIRNSKLVKIPLNVLITGNSDYKGLTMKQYEEYYSAKKKMQAKGRIDNEKIDSAVYANNESIVKSAKKNVHSRTTDIRSSREIDKQKVSYEGKISTRLENKDETSKNISADEQKENGVTEYRDYASFEEALQDFYDNN